MGRGRRGLPAIRFIWNKSDAVATNTYLLLYPKPPLARLLQSDDGVAAEIFELLKQSTGETMSELSRLYAGGLCKVEPGELRKVRLPSPPPWLEKAHQLRSGLWS
jgi:hypothetical protein